MYRHPPKGGFHLNKGVVMSKTLLSDNSVDKLTSVVLFVFFVSLVFIVGFFAIFFRVAGLI